MASGFFARLGNLWKGFLGLFIADFENSNPAAVYKASIEERIQKYNRPKLEEMKKQWAARAAQAAPQKTM